MLDILAYPHIIQIITQHCDLPTLAVLFRVSTHTQQLALPLLYPSTYLFDPIPSLISPITSETTTPPKSSNGPIPIVPAERIAAKLESLLSSPHLARVQQIVITEPEIFAAQRIPLHGGSQRKERGGDTLTTIWVKGTEKEDFENVLKAASLIPSPHLVLYAPAAAGVNISTLILCACEYLEPPESMHKLTLIIGGSPNHLNEGGTPIFRSEYWKEINFIFLPDGTGSFTLPSFGTSIIDDITPQQLSLLQFGFILTAPCEIEDSSAEIYRIVGLEGLTMPGVERWRIDALRAWIKKNVPQNIAPIEHLKYSDWRRDMGESMRWLDVE